MVYFGNDWGEYEMKAKQYFMYGILVSYNAYLDASTNKTIDDVLKVDDVLQEDDDIQGIFTGRDGNFIIIGKVLKIVNDEDKESFIVPELQTIDEMIIRKIINERYNFINEFHYYFIRK